MSAKELDRVGVMARVESGELKLVFFCSPCSLFPLTIRLFFAIVFKSRRSRKLSGCGIRRFGSHSLGWVTNPWVEPLNAGVESGLRTVNPWVDPGLNRVSPLDSGLTAF